MIDLLRHGETQAGTGFFGRTDVPLSEVGLRQMWEAVADGTWGQVVSSPLVRCKAFAQAYSVKAGVPLTLCAALQEYNFGAWEGLTATDVMALDSEALGRFWQDPYGYTPPEAESMSDFSVRVTQAIETIQARFAGQRVLVVTHAGVMRFLLARQQGLARDKLLSVTVEHAGLYRL